MKTVKQADYNYIDTLVRALDDSNELSAKISGRIDFDEHFSVIVEKYFSDISKCAEFIIDNSIVKKNVCADIDCYATSFEFTLAREIDDDDHDEMLSEINEQFASNLKNYLECIEVQASDYTIERQWCLIPYDEYLEKCLQEASAY
jgi:hypothetical protein